MPVHPIIVETKNQILLILAEILQAPETTASNRPAIKPPAQSLVVVAVIRVAVKIISYFLVTFGSYGHDL